MTGLISPSWQECPFFQEHPQVGEGCLGLLSGQPDHEWFGEREEAAAFAPAGTGHLTLGAVGEWIAAQVFDIELESSAVAAGIDGRFRSGPLHGQTVNIKWYLKREGMLDTTESRHSTTTWFLPDRRQRQRPRAAPPGPGVSKPYSV